MNKSLGNASQRTTKNPRNGKERNVTQCIRNHGSRSQTDENLFLVKLIRDQSPKSGSPAREEESPLVIFARLPSQWKVILEYFMTHEEDDGIHSRIKKRRAGPPLTYVDHVEESQQKEECHGRQRQHKRQRPQIFIQRNPSSVLTASAQQACQGTANNAPSGETTNPLPVMTVGSKNFPGLQSQKHGEGRR